MQICDIRMQNLESFLFCLDTIIHISTSENIFNERPNIFSHIFNGNKNYTQLLLTKHVLSFQRT